MAGLVLVASVALLSSGAQAQTYKAISLDGGGHTSGFAQSKANTNRIYAYGDVFGAWRTDDKGTTWSYLNWGIKDGDIVGYGMAAQQDNADVVYYLTINSLYKSTNSGNSWDKLLGDINWGAQQPNEYQRVRGATHILINSGNSDELWLASPRKDQTGTLWKKSPNTTTWTKMGGSTFDVSTNRALTVYQSAIYPSHIWVGTEKGLYVTDNGGSSFRQVTSDINVGMIRQFNNDPYKGVLLINYGKFCCDSNGVMRITAANGAYSDITKYSGSRPTQVNMGYPTGLQVFSDNTAVALNTAGDVQGYSTDGGQTFAKRATNLDTKNVPVWTTAAKMTAKNYTDYGTDQVFQVGDNPDHWIITGGGAAMESTNKGVTWSYFPNGSGIAAVKTYSVTISRLDEKRMYIPASDIGAAIVTDGGASGTAVSSTKKFIDNDNLHNSFRIMEGPDKDNLVLAGIRATGQISDDKPLIMKSNNGGLNWTVETFGNLPDHGIVKSVMSLTDKNDFLVVLADENQAKKVYRTKDGGSSFSEIPGLPDYMGTGYRYDATAAFIERDATETNVRYFVAREKPITLSNGSEVKYSTPFYRSTNGGDSWSATASHPFVKDGNRQVISGLVVDPVRSKNIWAAGGSESVKYSTDGGDNWTGISKYFVAKHIGAYDGKIAVWGKAANEEERLWYSPDNGQNWYAQSTFEENFHGVQGVAVDKSGKIWVSWNSVTVVTPVTPNNPVPDTEKPTAPSGLKSSSLNSTSFTLEWTASTDNVGVSNYEVFKDGNSLGTTTTTSYNVTGLTAGTTYSMTVSAKDAAGNTSDVSSALSVITTSANNLGFENDFTSWSTYGTASINTANVRSGSKSGYFAAGGGNYIVTGLTSGATYKVKAWVKAVSGTEIWITVDQFGGTKTGAQMTSTSWTQSGDIVFKMGDTNTSVSLGTWTGSSSSAYFDDFTIEAYTPSTSDFSGTYKITARHVSKALDVSGGSTADGANVQQWTDNGTAAQQWVITATSNGYYKIVNKGSNKALQVASSGTSDGNNVEQSTYTGANNQQWKIEATSDGFYKILNRNSGKAVDVAGVSTSDGANIHQWTYGGGNNQQWKLEQLSTATTTNIANLGSMTTSDPTLFESSELTVYPNPVTNGRLSIQLAAKEKGTASFTLTSVIGQKAIHKVISVAKGRQTLDISTSGLASGLYLLTIEQGNTRVVRKIYIK